MTTGMGSVDLATPPTYARHAFKIGGYLTEEAPDNRCVWRVDGHSPYCDIARSAHDDILARRRAGTWRWTWGTNAIGRLDPDPLIDAVKYADAAGAFDGDRIYADIAALIRERLSSLDPATTEPKEPE